MIRSDRWLVRGVEALEHLNRRPVVQIGERKHLLIVGGKDPPGAFGVARRLKLVRTTRCPLRRWRIVHALIIGGR